MKATIASCASESDSAQFPKCSVLPFRRTISCQELRQIAPSGETTIYEMERKGEFPGVPT